MTLRTTSAAFVPPAIEFRRTKTTLWGISSPRALFLAGALALLVATLALTLAWDEASAAGSDAAGMFPDYGVPSGDNQNAGNNPPYFPSDSNPPPEGDPPSIKFSIDENTAGDINLGYGFVVQDDAGDRITLVLVGEDATSFSLRSMSSGELSGRWTYNVYLNADYEDPDDADGDNVYNVTLRATDNRRRDRGV